MLLSDQKLEDVVCTLQQLLSCCESFKNNSKTSDARAKLEQVITVLLLLLVVVDVGVCLFVVVVVFLFLFFFNQ
jgi:heme/copper-type cytochrome/quinol oxidase subunit 2